VSIPAGLHKALVYGQIDVFHSLGEQKRLELIFIDIEIRRLASDVHEDLQQLTTMYYYFNTGKAKQEFALAAIKLIDEEAHPCVCDSCDPKGNETVKKQLEKEFAQAKKQEINHDLETDWRMLVLSRLRFSPSIVDLSFLIRVDTRDIWCFLSLRAHQHQPRTRTLKFIISSSHTLCILPY